MSDAEGVSELMKLCHRNGAEVIHTSRSNLIEENDNLNDVVRHSEILKSVNNISELVRFRSRIKFYANYLLRVREVINYE